jgi:LemA protein
VLAFWVILALIVIVGFMLIGMYNGLVRLRATADNAWSDIDVQLKRRHDLIPNIVETVKGYAAHEKGTFENIARYRSAAIAANTPEEKAQAEQQLSLAMRGLYAVAENYPQLRANENFIGLQNTLSDIEDKIQNARRYYNAVVRDFNTRVQSFPTNILAGMFGFTTRQYFEMENAADRENVAVKF